MVSQSYHDTQANLACHGSHTDEVSESERLNRKRR